MFDTPPADSPDAGADYGGSGSNGGFLALGAFGESSPLLGDLDNAVTQLESVEYLMRKLEARRVRALAEVNRVVRREAASVSQQRAGVRVLDEDTLAYRSARAEVAATLRLTEQTTERRLSEAAALSSRYRETVNTLESGAISYRHAKVVLDAGDVIGEIGKADTPAVAAKRSAYEARVLEHATSVTPNRLQPIARRIAEEYATTDLDTRYEQERQRRTVWLTERENGMAEVGAYLPAHEAYGIHSRLTQIAKRIEEVESREARKLLSSTESKGEPTHRPTRRTRSEVRADLFSDLLLNGTGAPARGDVADANVGSVGLTAPFGVFGTVQVIVHEAQLDQQSHHDSAQLPFPELEGYGPIPVEMARGIAGRSQSWNRVPVQPRSGNVLRVDRYRPSEEMRRFLTARDQHCRFPGCRAPAQRCDIDHTIDAALGGATSTDNLGLLCRGHHTIKHHTGWRVSQHPDGVYDWTSPTGRTHTDTPVSRVRFKISEDPPPTPTQTQAQLRPQAEPF